MELKNFFAQDLMGNVIPSPTVTVYQPGTTTLATGLQNAAGAALANPFNGSGNGQVTLAAPDGDYDLKIAGAGRTTTMRVRFVDASLGSAQAVRADLAAPTGAGEVGFLQSGTGAVPRTMLDKAREVVSVRDFGAVGDGVTDDTAAVQAFAAAFETARLAGPAGAVILPGRYLLSDRIVFKAAGGFRSFLNWDGAQFVCNANRGVIDELIYFGNPASPATYQGALDVRGRAFFTKGPLCSLAPVGVRAQAMAQSQIEGINSGTWDNTIVDLVGPQNVAFDDWTIYNAGYAFPYLSASGSLFRQTGASLVRVSGTFVFPAHVAGKTIELTAGSTSRKTRITAWVSDSEVTVEDAETDSADQTLYFGSPAPATTAGSAVVTLDGGSSDAMLGLWCGIPGAGANARILWGRIVAVNTGAGTITLDKTASVTLNPTSNPLTQTTEIAVPAVAIRSDKTADGGIFSNGISQVRFQNLQIESYRGLAVGIDDAEFLHFHAAKMHGISGPSATVYSTAHIWGNQVSGSFIGEFDQRTMGRWKMAFARATQPMHFTTLQCRSRKNELLLGVWPNAEGFPGAEVSFGEVSFSGRNSVSFAALVDDKVALGGYIPPARLYFQNSLNPAAALSRKVFSDEAGILTVAGLLVSEAPQTFTPVIADAATGGNAATATSAVGISQRIGNTVTVSLRMTGINTTGLTPGATLYLRGLPIPVRGGTFSVCQSSSIRITNWTFTSQPLAYADDGDSHFLFYQNVSGAASTLLTVAALTSGTAALWLNVTYFAN